MLGRFLEHLDINCPDLVVVLRFNDIIYNRCPIKLIKAPQYISISSGLKQVCIIFKCGQPKIYDKSHYECILRDIIMALDEQFDVL